MARRFSAGLRTDICSAYVTRLGAGSILRTYNGAAPAGVAAVTGANTLLCTHTATGVLGVATATGIDVTETNFANVAANNIGGTPTFVDVCTSAGVVEDRCLTPGDGWSFSAAVVTAQAVALTGLLIPIGNL